MIFNSIMEQARKGMSSHSPVYSDVVSRPEIENGCKVIAIYH
jgi:hypothetical protein